MNEGVDNLVPPDADHFINTLKRYHAFYKTCDYRLLIVKENQRWLVLGGIIRLSSEDKNPSARRPFVQVDRLLVIHKVQEFHVNSLINVINGLCQGHITLENKEISQSAHRPPRLKTQEKTQWNMGGLKAPEPWPANLLIFTGTSVKEVAPDLTELRDLIRIHKPAGFSELHQLSEKLVAFPIYPSDNSNLKSLAFRLDEPINDLKAALSELLKIDYKMALESTIKILENLPPNMNRQIRRLAELATKIVAKRALLKRDFAGTQSTRLVR